MSEATHSTDPLVGAVLAGRYRLDKLLGEGGMGKVYAAEHVLMKKRLAVKVLHRELCDMPEVVARFEREAMATASIDHPNIAAATDCGTLEDGSLFLVLELVEGQNLRDEIALGPMPVTRALGIAKQIASALAAAHAQGIVHRDLKPENVMLVTRLGQDDVVKVLDFGIAKMPAGPQGVSPLTRAGTVFGTPEYMSPEQALGQTVDARADVYALGVITYEMLCGSRPFSSDSSLGIMGQQLSKPVPTFAERAPGVPIPRQVEQVVHQMLAKDLASRYQSAELVVAALGELLEPAPGAEARMFTLPDGSATAVLGTADRIYVQEPQVPAPPAPMATVVLPPEVPPAPAPAPHGPGGTLALLDDQRAQELAASVANARAPAPPQTSRLAPVRRWVATACDFVDARRGVLPADLRRLLAKVPAGAILAGAAFIVAVPLLLALVLVVHAVRKPATVEVTRVDAVPSASAAATDPLLREIESAQSGGRAALEKLAEAHPKSASVWLALSVRETEEAAEADAIAALGKALALDAKIADDPRASLVLAAGVRKRESADAAFGLLEGPMGAAGAAVAYDLSIDQKAPTTYRVRAQRWVVLAPEFLKAAAPAVEIAAKLRYAKSCADRHTLLPRAGEVGDARALAYLEIMKIRNSCGRRGRDDCFPCLRKDDALQQAIAAIKKRLGE